MKNKTTQFSSVLLLNIKSRSSDGFVANLSKVLW